MTYGSLENEGVVTRYGGDNTDFVGFVLTDDKSQI